MSVYNGEKYVGRAIESILAQTYTDFELLVVDDGSEDCTGAILESIKDPRLRVKTQERNVGLIASLNEGIRACQGELIVRMDADDISRLNRLQTQVAFADQNPVVGIFGSAMRTFGDGREEVLSPLRDHEDIVCGLLFASELFHPTVLMRRSVLLQHNLRYEPALYAGEDYGLWVDASKVCRLANVSEVLLDYRVHSTQVGTLKAQEQLATSNRIRCRQLKSFIPDATESEIWVHNCLGSRDKEQLRANKQQALLWLEKLSVINRQKAYYPEPAFTRFLQRKGRWVRALTIPRLRRKVGKIVDRIRRLARNQEPQEHSKTAVREPIPWRRLGTSW